MTVGVKLTTCRNLVFIGSLTNCLGYVLSSRATNIYVVLFSYGILGGVGGALTLCTSLTMISLYFDKKRGFANSLAVGGGSIGGLVFAPLLTVLFREYGYQGLMVIAAIVLNGCISAVLFRPPEFYKEKNKMAPESRTLMNDENADTTYIEHYKKHNENEKSKYVSDNNFRDFESTHCGNKPISKDNGHILKSPLLMRAQTDTYRERSYSANNADTIARNNCKKVLRDIDRQNNLSLNSRRRTVSENVSNLQIKQREHISPSLTVIACVDYMAASVINLAEDIKEFENVAATSMGEPNDRSKVLTFFKTLKNIFDLSLLKTPVFIAFEISAVLQCPGTILSTLFIAPYAKELNINPERVALLVTIYSAVDLLSRIIIAFISDNRYLRRSSIVAICSMTLGISSHLLRWYTTFEILVAYTVVLGLVGGAYFSLYAVIIVDFMSLDKLQSALGFTALFQGFASACTFFVVGYLRDTTGSYTASYHLLGTMVMCGGVIMFFLPKVQNRVQKRDGLAITVEEDPTT
ncbi:MOT5-like protein [Mya arenaria]|uniref:MOT5-like protein n=2 Tax=Mya arenaria TaxID=6604 RepID=A0ABY7G1V3_MYAAR|nr:monocarboxylate transporter 2-like isoform X2 [Mya arenaria]WAR28423.1 MOT5-like protein [Mya arenaria]